MASLEKLLKKLEENASNDNETKEYDLIVDDTAYSVRTLTKTERRDMLYSRKIKKETTVGDIVKWATPFIYKSLQLNEAAQAAKDARLIVRYYDIVEKLFEPQQILDILEFIYDINDVAQADSEVVSDVKKQ